MLVNKAMNAMKREALYVDVGEVDSVCQQYQIHGLRISVRHSVAVFLTSQKK